MTRTTVDERVRLADAVGDAIDKFASELNDEPDVAVRSGLLLRLIDDAARCAELEAEMAQLTKDRSQLDQVWQMVNLHGLLSFGPVWRKNMDEVNG